MKQRILLTADDGKILTDGEIYGRVVYLSESKSADDFNEITKEEYEKLLKEQSEEKNGDN